MYSSFLFLSRAIIIEKETQVKEVSFVENLNFVDISLRLFFSFKIKIIIDNSCGNNSSSFPLYRVETRNTFREKIPFVLLASAWPLWRQFLNIKKHLSNCLIFEQTNDLDRERGGESWRGSLLEMQRGRRGWELGFVPSYPRSLSRW